MNEIRKQVALAHRRMWIAQFLDHLLWASIFCFSICALALLIPKLWPLAFLQEEGRSDIWNWSWLGAAAAISFTVAVARACVSGPGKFDAAVEIDARFKLKERLSSAWSLPEAELESPSGRALIRDAVRRAEVLEVKEKFGIQLRRLAIVPVALLLAIAGLFFLKNAVSETSAQAEQLSPAQQEEIKQAIEITKKQLREKMQEFENAGLDELDSEMRSISRKLDELQPDQMSKKETMIQLNDIQREIQAKQSELGDIESLKRRFEKMSDSNSGLAREFSDAIKEGELDEAKKLLDELSEKIADGSLDEREQKKIAQDLNRLAEQLADMAEQHEQAKQDLQRQINQAAAKGDMTKAGELQQKLDELEKSDRQSQQMKRMSDAMGNCAECMGGNRPSKQGQNGEPSQAGQNQESQSQQGQQEQQGQQGQQGQQSEQNPTGGNPSASQSNGGAGMSQQEMQQAQQALQQMSEQLEQMQNEMQQMQTLQDLADQMSDCKGMCNSNPSNSSQANGRGPGAGERPQSETDTAFFKSKVDAEPKDGETVVTGQVDGPNKTGQSVADVREQVVEEMNRDYDPLENQRLPRRTQDHVKEYFQKLRGDR